MRAFSFLLLPIFCQLTGLAKKLENKGKRFDPPLVATLQPGAIDIECQGSVYDRGYENAKSFASLLLAYSLWLMVRLRQLQAISHKL